jgi:hypothetical protein
MPNAGPSGPARLEPSHCLQARSKLQVGGILGAAARLDALPGGIRVGNASPRLAAVARLVRNISKLVHIR